VQLLVVDDITDTGKSLIASTNYLRKLAPGQIKTATMQYMPTSAFKPDYFSEEVKVWTWFIYPWNWIEDTSTLIVRLMVAQKEKIWTLNSICEELKELFEIELTREILKQVLIAMADRNQVVAISTREDLGYKLKEEKVIQL
jgi:hypoxanthine phosphoribosyltransferase